ncbi:endonuclease NucS [Candidatus Parcubacteria bacterium]|nr:endonuclease NucS [Candidatus Parcubacteria bacterium]
MQNWKNILDVFILQAQTKDLKTASYPKEWAELTMKVSFGMGSPARIPWIGLKSQDQEVSRGIYPVYLYYKDLQTLILAYGISETEEPLQSWPAEILNSAETVTTYFKQEVPRYGGSFVFKSYKIRITGQEVSYVYSDTEKEATKTDLASDLSTITEYYKKIILLPSETVVSKSNQGLFYMEKQLEDFIIHNWDSTEFSKKYDLIIENGELLSQQFKTDVGPIDILARNKKTGSYLVIELKKNQTSDDTVGQLARYMGWVKKHKADEDVSGIIIAGQYDERLDYARTMFRNVEVYIYQVDFRLNQFRE